MKKVSNVSLKRFVCREWRILARSAVWPVSLMLVFCVAGAYGNESTFSGVKSNFLVGKSAFQESVSGTVLDEKGVPMPGVSVVEKGTTNGTITDLDGNFKMQLRNKGATLEFSFLGYETKTVVASASMSVQMQPQVEVLSDVVVTALGIKRERKTLAYSAQEVKEDEISRVKDANFVNALTGKVAGVAMNSSSSGIGGATKIVMRGAKSIEKSNNALYVIDGVPLLSLNYFGAERAGEAQYQSGGSTEGIADLNPEDIESVTVLTGASAAALYGSAAANGAILITTKAGKQGKLNVSISSRADVSSPLVMPRFQNKYGNDGAIASWGAELPADAERYDPKQFFQTPLTFINTVSLSGGSEKNQTFVSLASTNSEGLVPNNLYDRYNFTARNTTSLLKDRLKIDFSASYILQNNRNTISQGDYFNPVTSAYLLPRGYGLDRAKAFERYNPTTKIYEQSWGDFAAGSNGLFSGSFAGQNTLQNPYWAAYRNIQEMKRERDMLTLKLSYDIKKWSPTEKWDVYARVRTDRTGYESQDRRYASTLAVLDVGRNGYFGQSKGIERQTYVDILTNFNKKFPLGTSNRFISTTANFGFTLQDSRVDASSIGGPLRDNGIPNVFNLFNIDQASSRTNITPSGWIEQTQSVLGSVDIGYNDYLFLTVTGRNDWASQLAKSPQSSFFYPSVGLSAVVTDMLPNAFKNTISPVLSYLKLRASYSSVGSPFGRWLTTPTYSFNAATKAINTVTYFPIGSLYPERTGSYEVGFSSKWLHGKLNMDLTYYITNTYNQTITSSISPSSGYDAFYLQTGDIENKGIEFALGYDLEAGKFKWNTNFTLGYNKNLIKSLVDNYINPITQTEEKIDYLVKNSVGALSYVLRKGGSLGDVYSTADFRRDQNGNIITDANGNVSVESFGEGRFQSLGSVLPNYTLGWVNNFSIGNFSLGCTIGGRIGGVVVSATQGVLDYYGVSEESANARDAGGVAIDGNLPINPQSYFETRGINRLPQYYTYSATNFRLQEAYISYRIPRKAFKNVMDLTISVVGRNLAMLYLKAPFDPQLVASTGNYVQGVDYFMWPSLRTFGLNLRINI